MMDDTLRNPDGTVKAGGVLNPEGKNGLRATGQPYKIRAKYLEEQYPTLEDLYQFFDLTLDADQNIKSYRPNKVLRAMPHRDATILMGMFEEFVGSEKVTNRREYWDRNDGKPTQRNELTGKDGSPIVLTSSEAAAAVRGKLLPELGSADQDGEAERSQ